MDADVTYDDEPPSDRRTLARRFGWLLALGGVAFGVIIGLALSNPGEQAHRTALGGKTHCRYNYFLLFSTMDAIELDGSVQTVSTGFLGTVSVLDNAQKR